MSYGNEVQSAEFGPVTAAAPYRVRIPKKATAFLVQGFPDAAATIPSTLPHYRARLTYSMASGSPVGAPGNTDVMAEYDFLEHPWLWGRWIILAGDDADRDRALTIHNGGNAACAGAIARGRVLFSFAKIEPGA
jgi:hypothetical protein